jgi:hypothetical protein
LKPGLTKFWLWVSALILVMTPTALDYGGARAAIPQAKEARENELSIAGFRPGKDTLAAARTRIGKKLPASEDEPDRVITWHEFCYGKDLRIEADAHGVIQSLDLSEMEPMHRCSPDALAASQETGYWRTGRGLSLGDSRKRVIALYGQPGSNGPSQEGDERRELLYYAFDWAGSDVPQVMEVSCDKATGRVVEIMLAFPSL